MAYFDSPGVHRTYAIGFDGAELTITRDAPGFAQHLSATLGDGGSTLTGEWQLDEDDRGYRDDLAFTYRRVLRTDRSMGAAEREAMASGIVDSNRYMTLGTADADAVPWASPVWQSGRKGSQPVMVGRTRARTPRARRDQPGRLS